MKKQSKDEALNQLVRELIVKDGAVLCKACSVPNWDMYHAPGIPCPKLQCADCKRPLHALELESKESICFDCDHYRRTMLEEPGDAASSRKIEGE